MAGERVRRSPEALRLATHAWLSTPPETPAETEACNARFARARWFLMHGVSTSIVVLGVPMSASDVAEHRAEALEEMRDVCAACGACVRFGMKPP